MTQMFWRFEIDRWSTRGKGVYLVPYGLPVLLVGGLWDGLGGPHVDPGGLTGGRGRAGLLLLQEQICHHLELLSTIHVHAIRRSKCRYI